MKKAASTAIALIALTSVSNGAFAANDVPPNPPIVKPVLPPHAAATNTPRNSVPGIAQAHNPPAIAKPVQQYETEWSRAVSGGVINPAAPNRKLSP